MNLKAQLLFPVIIPHSVYNNGFQVKFSRNGIHNLQTLSYTQVIT
jgi:hypothetical protein